MDLEVRHLQLVSAVAAVGGLTRAGRHLNLSQSALSHQLRDVETRLGTPLFLRVGKRMVPTAAGERLVKSAHEILESLASAERAIHLFAGGERGRLRVIVAGYASYRWLPSVLKRYREIHPKIEVQIPETGMADAAGDVLAGAVDVAIGPGTADDKRLHLEPLVRDEVVLAVPDGHRLAAYAFADVADLGGEPILVDASERGTGVYREIIAAAGSVPGNVVIAETSATLELIQAGFGIAVVGRWVIEPQIRAGTLRAVRITRKGVWCCWSALMLKHLATAPHVRDFVALVAREMSRLTASEISSSLRIGADRTS
jgi:LysR family transcriptional regulator, regulator for metE and metH